MVKAKAEKKVEEDKTEESAERMEGTVKWFNVDKGYGFIEGDDGDYFVHISAMPEGTILNEGEKVTFTPTQNERGKQAQDVEKVQE